MYKSRIVIHIVLILSLAIIAIGGIDSSFSAEGAKSAAALFFMFLVVVYFNMQVLLPCFLFKNKFWSYMGLSALSIFVFTILFGLLNQLLIIDTAESSLDAEESVFLSLITLTAVIIKLGFILAGISAFMLFGRWTANTKRANALENATIQSELEQLKNQINPHFLFNMLNNINELTKEVPDEAANVLFKLNELLKYQLNDSVKDEVSLNADIQFLTYFLNLEKIRRDNFELIISTAGDLNQITVPPLLFIPFVENAVKHGNDKQSYIHLYFKAEGDRLNFICINSKPKEVQQATDKGGLGLSNIKRRLELLYGEDYSLDISENEITYSVKLYLKI